MAFTRDQLKTRALGDDFDATKYGTQAEELLNEAVHRVARRVHIPTLESGAVINTVAGTLQYDRPADDVRELHVVEEGTATAEPRMLDEVSIAEFDMLPHTSGRPTAYALWAGTILFHPTPDAVYRIELRYLKNPAFTASGTTTTSIGYPDDYSDALVSYVRSRLFRLEDDGEMATYYMGEFDRAIAEMRSDFGRPVLSRKRQVPGMWASGAARPSFTRPS